MKRVCYSNHLTHASFQSLGQFGTVTAEGHHLLLWSLNSPDSFGGGAWSVFCLEGTGSRTCMCACPTCLPAEALGRGKATSVQGHFKRAQTSVPPELTWSPYLHHLCVFALALWPGGWGRWKTLGWECLCAEFIVGACLAIGGLSSLGSALLRAGSSALCMEGTTHYHNVSPRRGSAPKSSVAKDSPRDNAAGSLWMDSPLLINTV